MRRPDLGRSPLRRASRVGAGARTHGRPLIANHGRLVIGSQFELWARPARSHIVVGEHGAAEIGDRVTISHGAAISCERSLTIGDGTVIGPFVVVHDSDFHAVGDRSGPGDVGTITIGARVRIGARVTIMRDSVIGDGAVIESGSVVAGHIAPGTTVGGVPARRLGETLGAASGDQPESVADTVRRVFDLPAPPEWTDGPDTIEAWDSLGALNLLLELEALHGVTLDEKQFVQIASVGELADLVQAFTART